MGPKVLLLCLGLLCGCASVPPCDATISCPIPKRPKPTRGPKSIVPVRGMDLNRRQGVRDLVRSIAGERHARYRLFFDKRPMADADVATAIFSDAKGDQVLIFTWDTEDGWQLIPTALIPDTSESI